MDGDAMNAQDDYVIRVAADEIGPVMRIYAPDLERFKNWQPPMAEKL